MPKHHYLNEERDAERGLTTTALSLDEMLARPPLKLQVNQFLQALLDGGSIRYAAGEARISYKTAIAWLAIPGIMDYYRTLEQELQTDATKRLELASEVALDTLIHIMLQEQTAMGVNKDTRITVQACKIVLDQYNLQSQNATLRRELADLKRQRQEPDQAEPDAISGLRLVI